MTELARRLGRFDAALLLVGSVIGSGIFVVPSLIARRIPEPGLVIAIWVFCGLLVLCGALTLAELGAALPQAGGIYVYIREAYGPFWAFLYGWTTSLVVIPGAVAALTTAFFLYLGHFLPLGLAAQKLLGIGLLALVALINCRGVRWGATTQNLFTFAKVAGLAALVVLAVVTQRGDAVRFLPLAPDSWRPGLVGAVGAAMISVLFAYDGWHFVGFVAGEVRDPERNVPSGIFLGVLIVVAVYVTANLAYYYVLGQAAIAQSERVAATAMSALLGPSGASLISLAILCSTFGAICANVLAVPRVFYAMARDRVFFPALAWVHPVWRTPTRAIWLLAGSSALLTLTGGYEHLITMAMFAAWILFAMAVASVIVLRRKHPEWDRPYRAAGYPFTPVVFTLVAVAFVVVTLVESPRSSLFGLGIAAAGLPFYAWWRKKDGA